MKKTLIALAALAATASFAQSSVSVDGIFDAGLMNIDYKGQKVTSYALTNGSSTSQINFRGTEDLGGGLKANFRFESDFNTTSQKFNQGAATAAGTLASGSSWGNGEVRVGLEGGFGRVDLGVVNHETLTAFTTGQPFGTAVGSTFRRIAAADTANAINASQVRTENAIKYITPSFNGFKASVYGAKKQTGAKTTNFSSTYGSFDTPGVTEFSLQYNNGPLNAVYSTQKTDFVGVGVTTFAGTFSGAANAPDYTATNATYTAKLNTLGANYKIGNFTLYGLNQTRKTDDNKVDLSLNMFSVAYPIGGGVLMAAYGEGKDKGTTNSATYRGITTKVTSLAYEYSLSKRTALYARYENIQDRGNLVPAGTQFTTAEVTNGNRTTTALGLRHSF